MHPGEEKSYIESLPSRFSRQEIFEMIDRLREDVAQEDPPLKFEERVRTYQDKHKKLLFSMPLLYRTVLKGTYRPFVVETILDAREAMERGVAKDKALEEVIRKAVDEVNDIRGNEQSS